jgi:hypothetical protein
MKTIRIKPFSGDRLYVVQSAGSVASPVDTV